MTTQPSPDRVAGQIHPLFVRVSHRMNTLGILGVYSAVQRLLYLFVLCLGILVVLSGVATWKPVQAAPLTALMGGYDTARTVHFLAMAGIVGFVAIHVALVLVVPRTLPTLIFGRKLRVGRPR